MPSKYAKKRPPPHQGPQVGQSPWKQMVARRREPELCTNCGSENPCTVSQKWYACRCGGVFQAGSSR
jgi:hypothetical protein